MKINIELVSDVGWKVKYIDGRFERNWVCRDYYQISELIRWLCDEEVS